MTKYEIKPTSRFRKDFKLVEKQGKDMGLLYAVILQLADGIPLPAHNRDHTLTGRWAGHRECHIQSDWLLIYRIDDDALVLTLSRTGSHNDLF
jgi:mRNA interferase YafQ